MLGTLCLIPILRVGVTEGRKQLLAVRTQHDFAVPWILGPRQYMIQRNRRTIVMTMAMTIMQQCR